MSIIYTRDDIDFIVEFAGCSLDEKPGSNWVQGAGGLPEYICQIARAIKRSGKTTSEAIAIAVSRVKKWSAGVGVDKDTQAKAAAALAEWEKLKAKSKAKSAGKKSSKVLAASHTEHELLNLASGEYDVSIVAAAFNQRTNEARRAWRKANPNAGYDEGPSDFYVKETWNKFLIVQSGYGRNVDLYKVNYSVSENNDVTFSDPVEVKTEYVVVDDGDEPGADITDTALKNLMAMAGPCPKSSIDALLNRTPRPTALQQVLTLSQIRH